MQPTITLLPLRLLLSFISLSLSLPQYLLRLFFFLFFNVSPHLIVISRQLRHRDILRWCARKTQRPPNRRRHGTLYFSGGSRRRLQLDACFIWNATCTCVFQGMQTPIVCEKWFTRCEFNNCRACRAQSRKNNVIQWCYSVQMWITLFKCIVWQNFGYRTNRYETGYCAKPDGKSHTPRLQ